MPCIDVMIATGCDGQHHASRAGAAGCETGFLTNLLIKQQQLASIRSDSNLLKRDFAAASELERQGFERLLERDFNGARRAFEAVERTYPSFHQAYEIARLLQREQSRLPSPEVQRRVLTRIISDYSWKAPADLLTAIERSLAN